MLFICVSATDCVSDVGPASVIVGNLVQGNRLASAQGRDIGMSWDEDNDDSKKVKMQFFLILHVGVEYYFLHLQNLFFI